MFSASTTNVTNVPPNVAIRFIVIPLNGATLEGHTDAVWCVAFAPGGKVLATGSADHTIKLWDAATGKLRTTLKGHADEVLAVAFSPDGKILASAGGDLLDTAKAGEVILWDVARSRRRFTLKGHTAAVLGLAFSPDGQTLATGGTDRKVILWNVKAGKQRSVLPQFTLQVRSLAFAPDNRTLAVALGDASHPATPGEVILWDTQAGRARPPLISHRSGVTCLAIAREGQLLATGGFDETVNLWRIEAQRKAMVQVARGRYWLLGLLHRRQWLGILLVGMTLASYCMVIDNDFVDFDDNGYVFRNDHVQEGLTLDSIAWAFESGDCDNWHPLTWLSLELDYEIYGLEPWGFHLTNLLLHAANGLLLFWLLESLTGRTWCSAVVAALFAVHPLHVESVAWVAERKDVLSTFFGLLALHFYARYAKSSRRRWYVMTLAAFALCLMAKPMLVTLPFVLLLLDYWPLQRLAPGNSSGDTSLVPPATEAAGANASRRPSVKWLLLEKVPFLILSAACCEVTLHVQLEDGEGDGGVSLAVRVGNAAVAYVGYLLKMVWPGKLCILYPHPRYTLTMAGAAWAFALLAAITLAVLIGARRHRYLLVGWLWYLGTLVPVIGLVQVGTSGHGRSLQLCPSDRRVYHDRLGKRRPGSPLGRAEGGASFCCRRGAPGTCRLYLGSSRVLV